MIAQEVFEKELTLLNDLSLYRLACDLINGLPDYFFKIPASSSGKYHPQYALGDGGLVRHTKAAVQIVNDLLALEQYESLLIDRDYIIIALLIHDGFKNGLPNEDGSYADFTVKEHPWIAANYVRNFDFADKKVLQKVAEIIETHMGQWNYGILPKPKTDAQKLVHLADYLASRRYLDVDFCKLSETF